MSQAEIENELRKHGSGFTGGKQRIIALYQIQPDRKLRAKALAKEYGIGGHSHDFLDGSRGFVNHDWKGLEFDHYPDHQKITLKWAQVEKYIDLMIQSDRYLTDKEKEHYTPPVPITVEPDATLTHAKNLIRDFCLEEYDSEPDFSDLSKIGIAYTHATDEDIPIQVNVDLVGYRVERYLGEVLIDERQYESLEDLTETELEALDFSELVSVTDEELEHYHSKAEERPALLPLDAATEYNALKEQHPDALVGFEQNGQFEFYADDAQKVSELLGGKLLEKETALGTVPVIGFPRDQWAYRAKQLWQCGENVYVKMLPLCSDGSILGLTVFQKCGFTVTLGDGTKLVEVFMPKDVVIDSALASDSCTGCRNFTIAHEAAHHILADLFPNDYGKAVKCRGHIAYRERNGQPSWEEWQANTLAAELLMPTFLVNAEIERAALCLPNGILYKSASDPNYERILEMAARIGVSWSAIRIRLQQMQVINGKPIHCHPLDVIRFGE